MKLKPTKYAHNSYTINISYYKNKKYNISIKKQRDFVKDCKLTRRTYKVSRFTVHYSLYYNIDFECAKRSTDIYYSIYIK